MKYKYHIYCYTNTVWSSKLFRDKPWCSRIQRKIGKSKEKGKPELYTSARKVGVSVCSSCFSWFPLLFALSLFPHIQQYQKNTRSSLFPVSNELELYAEIVYNILSLFFNSKSPRKESY